jgi:hypothetical protein
MGYTKLFSNIVTSSIWCEDHDVLRVWVAFLALSDADSKVEGSIPGMASLCRVTIERFEEILQKLKSPDPYSRTEENEGRRIADCDGGWIVLNRKKYRDRTQDQDGSKAAAMRRSRARKKGNALVSQGNALPRDRDRDRENIYTNIKTSKTKTEVESDKKPHPNRSFNSDSEETSKVDIDLQPIEEALAFLPLEKDRAVARTILTTWKECRTEDAIAFVQQAKPFLMQLEEDQETWIRRIVLLRLPTDPVYDKNGRNLLHQWLMNCIQKSIRKNQSQGHDRGPQIPEGGYGGCFIPLEDKLRKAEEERERELAPKQRILDDLFPRLEGVKTSIRGYIAHCPVHDDHEHSMLINIDPDTWDISFECSEGCDEEAIVAAIGDGIWSKGLGPAKDA